MQFVAVFDRELIEVSHDSNLLLVDIVIEKSSVDPVPEDTGILLESTNFDVLKLIGILWSRFEEVVLLVVVFGCRGLSIRVEGVCHTGDPSVVIALTV